MAQKASHDIRKTAKLHDEEIEFGRGGETHWPAPLTPNSFEVESVD